MCVHIKISVYKKYTRVLFCVFTVILNSLYTYVYTSLYVHIFYTLHHEQYCKFILPVCKATVTSLYLF